MNISKYNSLFKIENAKVVVKCKNIDLIIETYMDIYSFAMGNNIRENDLKELKTVYVFKNYKLINQTISYLNYISFIYDSYIKDDKYIIFTTNDNDLIIECEEVIIHE